MIVPKHNHEIAEEVKEKVGEMIEEIEDATDVLIGGEKPKK